MAGKRPWRTRHGWAETQEQDIPVALSNSPNEEMEGTKDSGREWLGDGFWPAMDAKFLQKIMAAPTASARG